MENRTEPLSPASQLPVGQRLYDNVYLLLALGILVMVLFYTGWGLWEITSMPTAQLP